MAPTPAYAPLARNSNTVPSHQYYTHLCSNALFTQYATELALLERIHYNNQHRPALFSQRVVSRSSATFPPSSIASRVFARGWPSPVVL